MIPTVCILFLLAFGLYVSEADTPKYDDPTWYEEIDDEMFV